MIEACAASRAHNVTSSRAASTQLIAVPQAPAPSTAMRMSVPGDFVARAGLRRRRVLLLLEVERFEVERRENHRRKAAARNHVGNGFAQVGIDERRAGDAEERPELLRLRDAQLEDAGLPGFGEEERALADGGRHRGGHRYFVVALAEIVRAGIDLHLELGLHLLEEDLRRMRDLEREVLHIDLLDLEGPGLCLLRLLRHRLRVAHEVAFKSGSRPPWRSRSYRSSQPPIWRAPIQICGTVRRPPLFCIISARRAGSRSTRTFSIAAPFSTSSRSAAWQNGHAAVQYISTFITSPPAIP